MPQLFSNNSQSYVVAETTPQATIIVVADGDKFPELAINNDDFFLLTLVGVGTSGKEETWEIVKVTAKNSDTFTIVRGQEDTVAQSWPAVTPVECRFTAGSAAIVSADGVDGVDGVDGAQGPQGPIGEASEIFYSALPPADQAENPLWFNTETGRNYVWYEDINSGQWIQTTAEVEPTEIVIVSSETVTTVDVLTTPIGREAEQDLVNQQDVNWYLWDELETKMSLKSDQDISGDKTFTGYAYINKTSSQTNGIMPKSFILHSDSEVLTEAKVYVNEVIETKLNKTGGTMTGQLNVKGANLHMQGAGGVTNMMLGANGDISAKVVDATGKINAHSSIEMHDTKITGLDAPTADKNATNKAYVDGVVSDRVSKSGDTITGDLTVKGADFNMEGGAGTVHTRLHADGQIDANKIVLDRAANESIIIKQNGVTTLELWSGGAINCQKVKVTDYDDPDLVVPKSYVDSEIAANVGGSSGPAALGRPFKLEPSPGDNAFRLDAGRFQMATTGNVAWTATLSDVAYLSFCYEDLDGIVWRMQSQGLYGFPTNFIQIYSSDRMIGWWLYESWDAGFNFADYSTLGGVTIPVKSWNSTGNTTTLPANGEFRLHSPVWG